MNLLRLIAARMRQWRTRLWTRDGGRVRLREGAGTLALSLLLTLTLGATLDAGFRQLAAAGVDAAGAERALAWIFTGAIGALLVLDLHHVFTAMVSGPDLDLLRMAPLARREIALLLLLDAVPHALPPVLALAMPAALAFQHAYGTASAGAIALALLTLFVTPVALGLALALPLARIVPPRLMREMLGILATLTLVLAWLANSFLLPHVVPEEGAVSGLLAAVARSLPATPAWSPASWAAQALAGGAHAPRATGALAAALAAAALLAWASTWLHVESACRLGAAPARSSVAAHGPVRIGRSVLAAFFTRDRRLLGRDWSVGTDIAVTALLWSLLPLIGTPLLALEREPLVRATLLMLAVGLGHEIGSRALALERSGIAWAMLAPPGPAGWVRARYATACAAGLTLYLAGAGLLLTLMPLGFGAASRCLLTGAAALSLAIAAGLWAGARFADPDWVHPRAMLRPAGRLMSALLMILQTVGWLAATQVMFTVTPQPPGYLVPAALALTALAIPALLSGAGSALRSGRGSTT